ncbi:TRAP transporter large permease [Brenneria rubrifaciens]|uniref:TRAP transporter large permease protein n=1 Tax=Brenneria rubrifaciens TaxID=55213 RepID=A0A4P8QS94_9GAMM|nr:TRAP transporter large permease [Brenneria rubrifaciens]QCR08409.1 TRAP transporter large permease [Brenneria rubrifaciens]
MSDGAWVLIGMFTLMLLLDMPVAFGLLVAAMSYLLIFDGAPLMVAAQQYVAGMQSFTLLAIPMFVLAAQLMNHAGLTTRIVKLCMASVGDIRGGLAVVAVLACVLFGSLSGSGVADVVAVGGMLLPAMRKEGYAPGFSSALIGTSSSIATVLPPSIVMIVYGTTSNTSIGKLFMGGVIPGLMLAAALIVAALYLSRKNNWAGGRRYTGKEKIRAWFDALPALMVPVLIIGGIRMGVFTATEAAISAIAYALILGVFIYRCISWREIWHSLRETAEISAAILTIIAAAGLFGWGLSYEQVPQAIATLISNFTESKYTVLLMLMTLLLVLGTFMETIAIIIIITPIVMPLLQQYGIDPIHFGILLTVNMAIGANTPPLGIDLMAACRVSGITVTETFKPLLVMLFAMLVVLLLLVFIPDLVLYLPSRME